MLYKKLFTPLGICLWLTFSLAGCASLTPPERPVYTGQDVISEVSASQLVGTWKVRELNPYPDSGSPPDTTIEYLSDGTLKGVTIPTGETAAVMGDMRLEMTGNWQVSGDIVTHSDIQMAGGNGLGAFINSLMNATAKSMSGSANVYELDQNRIVMVAEDGGAMEYIRQ